MLWQIIQEYISIFSIGIIVGFLIARYYYDKVSKHSLGKIIECALIVDEVEELYHQSKELDTLLAKIRLSSDTLFDKVKRSRDIEKRIDETESIELEDILSKNDVEKEIHEY